MMYQDLAPDIVKLLPVSCNKVSSSHFIPLLVSCFGCFGRRYYSPSFSGAKVEKEYLAGTVSAGLGGQGNVGEKLDRGGRGTTRSLAAGERVQ